MAAQSAPTAYDSWSCEQLAAESKRIAIEIDLLRKARKVSPKDGVKGGVERQTDANEAMVNRDSLASRLARFEEQREAIARAQASKGCR